MLNKKMPTLDPIKSHVINAPFPQRRLARWLGDEPWARWQITRGTYVELESGGTRLPSGRAPSGRATTESRPSRFHPATTNILETASQDQSGLAVGNVVFLTNSSTM